MNWKSGTRERVCDVCPGDLLDVRLSSASSLERVTAGYPVHLVFVPTFGHNHANRIGGSEPKHANPVEYRLDRCPTFFPFAGQVHLDGGVGIAYEVSFTRARCRTGPAEWTLSLRQVGVTPVQLPRGVYAISTPRDSEVTATAPGGDSENLLLAAGKKCPLGNLSDGTLAATTGQIEIIHCHVRL